MRRLFALMLLLQGCNGLCLAQTYQLKAWNPSTGSRGFATAICIGESDVDLHAYVLLTARHNISEGDIVSIETRPHRWVNVQSKRTVKHPTADVAILEVCGDPLKVTDLVDAVPHGAEVRVTGCNPLILKLSEDGYFYARSDGEDMLTGNYHAAVGDSGGGVFYNGCLVGIVSGHESTGQGTATRRTQFTGARTVVVPASTITQFVKTQYNCPNGRCRINIRQRIQQPMIGFGLPVGPPRIVNEAVPAPRPPQVYVPEQTYETPQTQPVPGPPGPPGPPGQTGATGPKGEPGLSVTQGQIEAVVNAWLDSNRDRLRGEQGIPGPPGGRGLVGVPDNTDIENWLRGAMSNPDSREMLRAQLRDLLAEDPKIQQLLKKIEESASVQPIDLELVGNGGTLLGSSRITSRNGKVLVESKTPDGVVAGTRSYSSKEPIRLNLRSQ